MNRGIGLSAGGVLICTLLAACGDDGGAGSPGTLSFSGGTFIVTEDGTPTAAVMVTRLGGTTGTVTATVTPMAGTATAGTAPLGPPADFDAAPVVVTFTDGDAANKVVAIPVLDDTAFETDETIALTLSSPTGGAVLGAFTTATLTIVNNDSAGAIEFTAVTAAYGEDGAVITPVTIRRVGGTAGIVSVTLATSDGTGNSDPASTVEPVDYAPFSTTVTFPDGNGVDQTVLVPGIVQDVLPETDETILLTLSDASGGATLGAQSTSTLTIMDDDAVLQLMHPTPTASDRFGTAVAAAGGRILVGAPFRTVGAFGSAGTVSVFDPATGSVISTISNPLLSCFTAQFGAAMAGDGRSVYVSAPGATFCGNGLAYEYDALTGAQVRQLTLPGTQTASTNGFAVLADLVAATDVSANVRLYDRLSGAQVFSFGSGTSLAAFEPLLLVGDNNGNQSAGVIYLFDPAAQAVQLQVANPFRSNNDTFGNSVAEFGGMLAAGAPGDDTSGSDAGSVYTFDSTTGSLILTLLPQAPLPVNGRFGNKIVAVRDRLAVQQLNGGPSACGRVFIYDTSGALIQTIDDPSPTANANFGSAMVEFDGALVIGAPMQTVGGASNAGSAWIFRVN